MVLYEGTTRNDDYSIALQKQYNNNTRVLDFDSKDTADEETVRNALLSAQKVADSTLKEANEQSEIAVKNAAAYRYKNLLGNLLANPDADEPEETDVGMAPPEAVEELSEEVTIPVFCSITSISMITLCSFSLPGRSFMFTSSK